MIVGVLDVQGDVSEHLRAAKRALGDNGKALRVKSGRDFDGIDALVIPGGESTTMGKLIREYALDEAIVEFANEGKPIMGTCAGMIILAKDVNAKSAEDDQPLLGLMDIEVDRNAFGRQRESFEADLNIQGIGEYHAVFIRAPVIDSLSQAVEVLSKHRGEVVMARQKNLLAVAFHPELTEDTRIHEYFIDLI